MQFACAIAYVPGVADPLVFFGQVSGLKRRFLHESGGCGELDTGATTWAFAALALGRKNLPAGRVATSEPHQPPGFEGALLALAVEQAHAQAVAAIQPPQSKPWGRWFLACAALTARWLKFARLRGAEQDSRTAPLKKAKKRQAAAKP